MPPRRGGRTVARGDDAQVVLPRELEARVGKAGGRGIDRLHLARVEVGGVRVEAIGQAVHRAVHHLVDVHLFHVVVQDEGDDVLEDLEVLVAAALRGGVATEEPADDREGQHRQRDSKDGGADAIGHGVGFSHCTGLTGRPSTRTSK